MCTLRQSGRRRTARPMYIGVASVKTCWPVNTYWGRTGAKILPGQGINTCISRVACVTTYHLPSIHWARASMRSTCSTEPYFSTTVLCYSTNFSFSVIQQAHYSMFSWRAGCFHESHCDHFDKKSRRECFVVLSGYFGVIFGGKSSDLSMTPPSACKIALADESASPLLPNNAVAQGQRTNHERWGCFTLEVPAFPSIN